MSKGAATCQLCIDPENNPLVTGLDIYERDPRRRTDIGEVGEHPGRVCRTEFRDVYGAWPTKVRKGWCNPLSKDAECHPLFPDHYRCITPLR